MEIIKLLTDDELDYFKDTPDFIKEIQLSEQKLNETYQHLLKGETTFVSVNATEKYRREALVHRSPEPTEFKRVSIFDIHGPVGHFTRNNLKEIAKEVHAYGFKPINEKDLIIMR